jgi:transcriptional regulator with XRE-family HTH domain
MDHDEARDRFKTEMERLYFESGLVTQEQLAAMANCSGTTINHALHAKVIPSVEIMRRIIEALSGDWLKFKSEFYEPLFLDGAPRAIRGDKPRRTAPTRSRRELEILSNIHDELRLIRELLQKQV